MCCDNCCTRNRKVEVGDRVHEEVVHISDKVSVRTNGAMTVRVMYLSDETAVVLYADRWDTDKYYSEKCFTRKEFDSKFSLCSCDPNEDCKVS